MAPRKYPVVSESPNQPDAGSAQARDAGRNAPAGRYSFAQGEAQLSGESLAGTTESRRHPPRPRDDATPDLPHFPSRARDTREGRDDEAVCLAAGVDEALAAVVDVTFSEGGLRGRGPGADADANFLEDDNAREKFADENERADGASGGEAANADVFCDGDAPEPDAVAGFGVNFAHVALSSPSGVGDLPVASFHEKSLAQAAPTPEKNSAAQQLSSSDMHVNTKARGSHGETAFVQQSSSGVTTALEAARSTESASK